MGARSAAVSVNDNATGSPQTVSLAGSGPDFSLAPSGSATATVTPGQTANYSLAVAASGGFSQNVMLSCTGAPPSSTCTVSPASVILGSTPTVVSVTVATTAASSGLVLPLVSNEHQPDHRLMPLALLLSGMAIFAGLARSRSEQRWRWAPVIAFVISLWSVLMITSCGGGNNGGHGGSPGTPPGTYTITVSGSFTSGSNNLTHSTNLTLVVK